MVRWMLGKDSIQEGKSQCMCIGTLVQRKEHSYHSYRPHLFILKLLPSLVPYVSQWRCLFWCMRRVFGELEPII